MNGKRFKTAFFIVAALLCIATALSLVLSNMISSSDFSETAKKVLNFFNFLPPTLGILAMTAYINIKERKLKTNK